LGCAAARRDAAPREGEEGQHSPDGALRNAGSARRIDSNTTVFATLERLARVIKKANGRDDPGH
jgi:hypothetical protein